MKSHRPFAVLNRTGNPFVERLLRSPAHRLLSGSLCLVTVTGRRSGRQFTLPVAYDRDGDVLRIAVLWPDRKRWWRNLREPAPVRVLLRGAERTGVGLAHGDAGSGVRVEITLDA